MGLGTEVPGRLRGCGGNRNPPRFWYFLRQKVHYRRIASIIIIATPVRRGEKVQRRRMMFIKWYHPILCRRTTVPTRQLPAGAVCGGAGVTLFTSGDYFQPSAVKSSPSWAPPTASFARASRRLGAALRTLSGMQSSAHVRRLHEWNVRTPRVFGTL